MNEQSKSILYWIFSIFFFLSSASWADFNSEKHIVSKETISQSAVAKAEYSVSTSCNASISNALAISIPKLRFESYEVGVTLNYVPTADGNLMFTAELGPLIASLPLLSPYRWKIIAVTDFAGIF